MATLRFTLDLPVARERVWLAITSAGGLAGWICHRAESDARLGGRLIMHWSGPRASSEPFHGSWVQFDPPEACAWQGGHSGYPDGDSGTVVFELAALAVGTRLTIRHSFPDTVAYDPFLALYGDAWPRALERLTHHLTSASPTA